MSSSFHCPVISREIITNISWAVFWVMSISTPYVIPCPLTFVLCSCWCGCNLTLMVVHCHCCDCSWVMVLVVLVVVIDVLSWTSLLNLIEIYLLVTWSKCDCTSHVTASSSTHSIKLQPPQQLWQQQQQQQQLHWTQKCQQSEQLQQSQQLQQTLVMSVSTWGFFIYKKD